MLEIKVRVCDKESNSGIVDAGVKLTNADYQRCAELFFEIVGKKQDSSSDDGKMDNPNINKTDTKEIEQVIKMVVDKGDILSSAIKAALSNMGRGNIEEIAVSLFKIYNEKLSKIIEEKVPASVLLDCSSSKE